MASIKRTIDIIFSGKDEISKTIRDISGGFDKLKDFTAPLAGLANSILKIEGALLATAAAFGAVALKSFADFEDTMLEIKGITKASGEEFERFTAIAEDAGVKTRFTAKEAAAAMLELARAGVKTSEDFDRLLIPTLAFVTASNLETGEATNALLKVMSQFGYSLNDMSKASDILVTTANSTTTNVKELTEALKFVGPVASQLGIPLETTSAALAVLAKQGFVAEMGGTALRNMFLALVAPTGSASKMFEKLGVDTNELGINVLSSKKALESLGVQLEDSNGKMLPFDVIIKNIAEGMNKLPTDMDKAGAAALIFGKRGGPQMLALLKEGQEGIQGFEKVIKESAGSTIAQAEIMESGVGGALRSLNSAIQGFNIAIGKELAEGWKPAIEGVRDFERALIEAVKADKFKPLLDIINTYGKRVGEAFQQLAKNIPEALDKIDWSGFIGSLGELEKTFSEMFDGVDFSTPEGLAAAIQKVIDTGETLNRIAAGIISSWKPVIDFIVGMISEINDLDKSTKETIGQLLGFSQQAVVVVGGLAVMGVAFKGLGFAVSGMAAAVAGSLGALQTAAAVVAGPAGLVALAGAAGLAAGDLIRQYTRVDESAQAVIGWVDKVLNFSGTQGTVAAVEKVAEKMDVAAVKVEDLEQSVSDAAAGIQSDFDGINAEVVVGMDIEKFKEDAKKLDDDHLRELTNRRIDLQAALLYAPDAETKAQIQADIDSITTIIDLTVETDAAKQKINEVVVGYREDGSEIIMYVAADQESIQKTKKEIEEISDKKLEIQAKIDIAQIQADTDKFKAVQTTIQTGFEWKAKLDIAEVEANTKILEKSMDNINTVFMTSKDIISDAFGVLTGLDFSSASAWTVFDLIKDQLKTENKLRQEALDLQKEITKAQIDYMNAKTQRLTSDTGLMMTVSAEGLQPHLEMIWFEILQALQIRLNEEAGDALIGL